MASVNVGDQVFFNESNDDVPSWTVATVVQTDTVPSADAVAAIVADENYGGSYPAIPDAGNVNLICWSMAGYSLPNTPQPWLNVSEGTGPRQWTTEAPSY